ncbi:3-hydroxyacyl-CoA dehydrogenase (plasmid) [Legionella adelaidensis]|uniref:3-hydroxyacyl CoA dehydrogenase oxidoreductase protein n=1 Tax=Legionella adelaidensis TaxID=45056 RepID=A0A0W0R441_9GAMM|nr:3-hydroxyacyl-CoA dehydrogenase/enoyl-CoA hydratase family protein [Legionella adelaidensis]KTC65857.1 3-hydroxyacyl CoA dehydrogenase oxidoreductase protein [Legionella adelaidensis]VEH85287.1 3-hydroxyacyl-CoA dehydrogenase [Legionella adelaidensis]
MHEPFVIKRVAVLGAGVMGAQIAAHCINAGIETYLYDLSAKEGNKDSIVAKAIAHLNKLKPAPLGTPDAATLLQAKNYEENLEDLRSCDLVIEAIAERFDWKKELYSKITPFLSEKAILVSNTSGLSINELEKEFPSDLKQRFCGVHFFNPPRYMHLVELIPAHSSSQELLNFLETWLTSQLGKGVVRAKDTPNFIANRVGVFSLLATLYHAESFELGLDEVDALTGSLIGRPKSATFRTMDVVGLDTMHHVVETMYSQLKDDPWHQYFTLPDWLVGLIKEGHLGQKTGQGIYRKNGKLIEVYDTRLKKYREARGQISEEVKAIMQIADPQERMHELTNSNNKQALFLAACFRDLFHYCAFHLQTIAETVRDVDLAIRWGFGWQFGPFEIWQAAGLTYLRENIEKAIEENKSLASVPLPQWLHTIDKFYTREGAFSPAFESYQPRSQLEVYKKQYFPDKVLNEAPRHFKTVYENEGVKLLDFIDDVFLLTFKSKANTIGQSVLDGMVQALEYSEKNAQGLIVYQWDENNFSSGADLRSVLGLIKNNDYTALEKMIAEFQKIAMRMKYSPIPTIAVLRGRALGGGCELMLHCSAVTAAFEAYPGLVEAGVGLLPAGGGCKEMALRAAMEVPKGDLMQFVQPYFEQIATAQVASSAPDALNKGYLKSTDNWVMHKNEVLFAALAKIKAMNAANYIAPLPRNFRVAGREGHARLQVGLVNWLEGGFISKHDYFLANQIAYVLCGGDVYQNTLVDEDWLLKLEREAFIKLAETQETQARINHLLETGKPLRN